MSGTSKNTKIIQAPVEKVYKAFTTQSALEHWMAPNGMTGRIRNFEPKEGRGYEMSLFYNDESIKGKTVNNEDRFVSTFVELEPNEKIIQAINFQSEEEGYKEPMAMEVYFAPLVNNATELTVVFRNIPDAIDPKDNEDGTEQSLEKLSEYLKQESMDHQ